jgi:hypothetical protein
MPQDDDDDDDDEVQGEDREDFDEEQNGDDVEGAENKATEKKRNTMTTPKNKGPQISIKSVIKSVTFYV